MQKTCYFASMCSINMHEAYKSHDKPFENHFDPMMESNLAPVLHRCCTINFRLFASWNSHEPKQNLTARSRSLNTDVDGHQYDHIENRRGSLFTLLHLRGIFSFTPSACAGGSSGRGDEDLANSTCAEGQMLYFSTSRP